MRKNPRRTRFFSLKACCKSLLVSREAAKARSDREPSPLLDSCLDIPSTSTVGGILSLPIESTGSNGPWNGASCAEERSAFCRPSRLGVFAGDQPTTSPDRRGHLAAKTSPPRSQATSFPSAVLDHPPQESRMDRTFRRLIPSPPSAILQLPSARF